MDSLEETDKFLDTRDIRNPIFPNKLTDLIQGWCLSKTFPSIIAFNIMFEL